MRRFGVVWPENDITAEPYWLPTCTQIVAAAGASLTFAASAVKTVLAVGDAKSAVTVLFAFRAIGYEPCLDKNPKSAVC